MSKFAAGIIAISLVLLTAADYAGAQSWRKFTTADGLAGNRVYTVLEDRHGTLWFGTDSGLSHFDRLFTTHLSGISVEFLLESQDGTIWAGTVEDGLYSYDDRGWQQHLSGMSIYSLLESRDGTIWVGTFLDGLHSYDGIEWQEHLSGMWVECLLESQDGTIWTGTREGLHSYDGSRWQRHLSGMSIISLLESQDGAIWAGTSGNGLHSYDGSRWQEHLSGMSVWSLFESQDGTIWVGTDRGLHSYDGTTWQVRGMEWDLAVLAEEEIYTFMWQDLNGNGLWDPGEPWRILDVPTELEVGQFVDPSEVGTYFSLLESQDGTIWAGTSLGLHSYDGTRWHRHLSGMGIYSLLESQDGIIWVGTDTGLHSYDSTRWPEHEHLSGMGISSLLESQDGTVWLGTSRGLHSYDGIEWQEHLSGMDISSLLESQDGTIWVGTRKGLRSYDGIEWQEHLSGMDISSLLESQDGTIWAGTDYNGLHTYDGTTWQMWGIGDLPGMPIFLVEEDTYTFLWQDLNGNGLWDLGEPWRILGVPVDLEGGEFIVDLDGIFGFSLISSLLESQDGTIWAGTDRGLRSYDGIRWHEHLSEMDIYSLLESQDGTIWVGTEEGLHSYDGSGWHEHLSGMRILSLLESRNGTIWAGTGENGLEKYDRDMWYEFTDLYGLPSNTVYAILEDRDEKLWLGTSNGIGVYEIGYAPGIKITNPSEQSTKKIGVSSLLIEWFAFDFETETHLLTCQHKIDDGEWSEPDSSSFVTIPSMNDGQHIFYVRAIDNDFNYSEPDTVTIMVDTMQPNVLISSPVHNAIMGGIVSIEGGVTDTDLVRFSVEYAESENPSDSAYKLIQEASERRSGELAELDTAELKEGGYTIRVRATDELEHTRDYTVYIIVDNTRPLIELSNPVPDQKLAGKTTIEGNVDDLHIAGYTLQIIQGNNVKWSETVEISASQKIERSDIDTSAIYGSATIRLTAADKAGNKSEPADVEVFFNNEGARPTARLESPRENDVIKGNFEIKGEARSVGIFKSYAVKYAAGHNPSEDDWADIGEGMQPSTERLDTWNTTTLPDGEYSIQLTATDENDYSSEHMVYVIIDNTEPVIELESPVDGGIEAGEVSIKGSATDSNFRSYRIQFAPGASPGNGWQQLVEVSESTEIDRTWRTDGLDGLYSIRVIAVDKAIPDPNETIVVYTITLDNTFAEAIITSPQEEDIVSSTVLIGGTANDDNFSYYQVFWGEDDNPSEWNPIVTQKTTPVINDMLTSWNTAGLEGIYTIRLEARDKSGHEALYSVLVTVDNTPPTAEITSPRDGEQVGGVVEIEGTAWDANLEEYAVWLEEGEALPLIRSATSVTDGDLLDWIPERQGTFTIRLTVTDKAEHKSEVSVTVEVVPEVSRDSGAEGADALHSSDEIATLSVPPRSLADDTAITINRVPFEEVQDVQPAPDRTRLLDSIYDIGPEKLKLRSIKPATLQMKLPGGLTGSDSRTAFFRWDSSKWTFLGGTLQEDKLTIGITELGRYALMEMEGVTELFADDILFTCQPRVFSPERGDKATITFGADEDTSVTLEVYNVDGWLERELVSGETMRVGRNAVVWDGRDDDGQILPSGIYLIALTMGDSKVRTKAVVILNQGVR